MGEITIDRLTLDLPGMPESKARQLALGIANTLALTGISQASGQVPTMRIDLTASGGGDTDALAKQIVAEIVRQLRRIP